MNIQPNSTTQFVLDVTNTNPKAKKGNYGYRPVKRNLTGAEAKKNLFAADQKTTDVFLNSEIFLINEKNNKMISKSK